MYDPSIGSYAEEFFLFLKESGSLGLLLILFVAVTLVLARHWRQRQDRWSSPFFFLYSLLPMAGGLINAGFRGGVEPLRKAFSAPSGHPYFQYAHTRYVLILTAGATLLALLMGLARTRAIRHPQGAGGESAGDRLGVILSVSAMLLSLLLLAADVLFFNFFNFLLLAQMPLANARESLDLARIPQAGVRGAGMALLVLVLLAAVTCLIRPGRSRPTPGQELALRSSAWLLAGAIVLFIAYSISQSWILSRIVIPF